MSIRYTKEDGQWVAEDEDTGEVGIGSTKAEAKKAVQGQLDKPARPLVTTSRQIRKTPFSATHQTMLRRHNKWIPLRLSPHAVVILRAEPNKSKPLQKKSSGGLTAWGNCWRLQDWIRR